MRIAYGIHGYGRGHAMRALAVLPHLAERHELLILAGGEAHETLCPQYSVVQIPTFKYHYDKQGKLSNYLSIKRNLPTVLDLMSWGPESKRVKRTLADFQPDIAISDSEVFTHRVARRLRVPRISFDHFGLLVYCRPKLSRMDRLRCWGNGLAYRCLFGEPERVIVSSFFDAPPRRPGVCVVGPVIRREVRQTRPSRGEHLLVYLSKGENEYTPQIERALLAQDCPVRIYGPTRQGVQGNLQFKLPSNLAFIEDLAACRAVFGTTGNQLLGEVLYFGKPMLGMPIACLEQRMNAAQLERMGIGMSIARGRVTAEVIRTFLTNEGEYVRNIRRKTRNGEGEALAAIERFATELTGRKAGIPAPTGKNT